MHDYQVESALWEKVEKILVLAETVRYAGASGIVPENQAREQLESSAREALRLVQQMKKDLKK